MSIINKIDKVLDEFGAYYVDYECTGPHAEACARGNKKKKKKVTEQFDYGVSPTQWDIVADEKVFEEMANFLLTLEPEQLNDIQLQKMIDIFSEMQAEAEMDEEIKADRSSIKAKQYAGKYYRNKKVTIKSKKKKLERSIKGKSRETMKPILAKGRKTPTKRHKVEYNV
jgi:hypothetical protein